MMTMDFKQFLHPKLALSFVIWLVSYNFMGVFGGSVAYYHFPRVDVRDAPTTLPDFGYDLIVSDPHDQYIYQYLSIFKAILVPNAE